MSGLSTLGMQLFRKKNRKIYRWEILVFCPQKKENNRKQVRKVSNQNEQLNFEYRYFFLAN